MKRSLALVGVMAGAMGLMACAAHPVQREEVPSVSDPTTYPPQPMQKPLPPPGYDPTLAPPPGYQPLPPPQPVPPPAAGTAPEVPAPPVPPAVPQTAPTPMPGQ